ncbi:hypothetical protein ABW19_dt0209524 [Dactylella cylindrospora]|nr:hypothetical protein ABW19_dt0209524 [Dactylella cylindrospora]
MRITLRLDGQRRASLTSSSSFNPVSRLPAAQLKAPVIRKRSVARPSAEKAKPTATISSLPKYTTPGSSVVYPANGVVNGNESSSESDWEAPSNVPLVISEVDRKSSLTHCFTQNGERLPWFELQPSELAVLRKRMKKNSSWQPSDAMMLKELHILGRGVRGFRKWARRTGQKKEDVDRILEGGDSSTHGIAVGALRKSQDNKGMRLNVMKRAKREREKAEAAAAAAAQTNTSFIQRLDPSGNSKSDAVGQSRASIRRTPTQQKETLREIQNVGPNSRTMHTFSSRKATTSGDGAREKIKDATNRTQSTRKPRKSSAGVSHADFDDEGN